MAIDEAKLDELIGQFVTDFGAAMHAATVVIGDKLGLYKALADKGPVTGAELAKQTGYDVRLVEEWLNAQFVSGYCEYEPTNGTFHLTDEQAAVLADDSTPAFLAGAMTIAAAIYKDEENIRNAFVTGRGLGWHEHSHDLFHGTERLFKPGYLGNLCLGLDPGARRRRGQAAGRRQGGRHRVRSRFVDDPARAAVPRVGDRRVRLPRGFDRHRPQAGRRGRRRRTGCSFEVASAQDFPGTDYDLVCIFDALHDMGDPVGGARHIRDSLADDGTWLLVEPMAVEAAREQRQSREPDLLRRGGRHLHARRRGAGRRLRPREPGQRRTVAQLLGRRGLLPLPPCHGDAVQPGVRGAEVATTGRGGRVACAGARPLPSSSSWASWTRTSNVSAMPSTCGTSSRSTCS